DSFSRTKKGSEMTTGGAARSPARSNHERSACRAQPDTRSPSPRFRDPTSVFSLIDGSALGFGLVVILHGLVLLGGLLRIDGVAHGASLGGAATAADPRHEGP